MKTIKHISLWVVVATCMVAVSTRGNAQAVSSTYFNVDWQFNAPVGNSYADKASGWGMNFEGGYYVMPKMAIGAFISYHTNNKYIDRQTLMLKSNSALTDRPATFVVSATLWSVGKISLYDRRNFRTLCNGEIGRQL